MAEKNEFVIGIDDFDASLLPPRARKPGTPEFTAAVQRFVEDQFSQYGGWAKIVVSDTDRTLRVSWGPGQREPDRLEQAVAQLQRGQYAEAVQALEVLRFRTPNEPAVFYNLGMALSDLGQLPAAVARLQRAVELDPQNANAHVSLGVALARSRRVPEAVASLREGVRLDPRNPWGHRNLGACLLQQGDSEGAEQHARRAVELASSDPAARLGLGQALLALDRPEDADEQLRKAIDLDPHGGAGEAAKDALGKLAQDSFRSKLPGMERPDAVMYLVGALDRFAAMTEDQVRQVGMETAVLGTRGLDPNDPEQKHTLRTLPGRYSGLHVLCVMYAAFKQVAPQHDIRFDLAREYEAAKALRAKKGN